jgi:hypothetical protein
MADTPKRRRSGRSGKKTRQDETNTQTLREQNKSPDSVWPSDEPPPSA